MSGDCSSSAGRGCETTKRYVDAPVSEPVDGVEDYACDYQHLGCQFRVSGPGSFAACVDHARAAFGSANISRKSLIDERFLI